MLKSSLCCLLVSIVCAGCASNQTENHSTAAKAETKKVSSANPPLLRHVILFRFKEDTSPEKIREVEEAFAALPAKISSIQKFEWGTNISKELTDGFTHCYVVTFANEAALEEYLNNPDLKAFRKSLKGPLEKALAFDYWTR